MSSNALAICWAPTLIGQTSTSGVGTFFVQECIEWADFLFPEEQYPNIVNQGLDFQFSQRATELRERNRSDKDNISDDYGFIGREVGVSVPNPGSNNNEAQAHSVLSSIRNPHKARKAKPPAPGLPNAVPLRQESSDAPRVQILHSSTPNLSSRSASSGDKTPRPAERTAGPVQTPPTHIQPRPQKRNKQTDYTGFGLMGDSDGEENLSLAEEMASHLDTVLLQEGVNSMGVSDSPHQPPRPAKPPPPKPPGTHRQFLLF